MIRVLMTGASNIGKAGVATIAFNLGQAMDAGKISVSYLAQRGVPDERYKALVEAKGGKIYEMPKVKGALGKWKQIVQTVEWVGSVARENRFDLIHINADTAYLAAVYIWIFKRQGTYKLVVHSHSTMVDDNNRFTRTIKAILHHVCRNYVRKNADIKLACSTQAAEWMFAQDTAKVIPNGIDIDRFRFDPALRKEYRKKMGMDTQFVTAVVGRLSYQKKPHFSIDVFEKVLNTVPNSSMLLVGDGELRQEIEEDIEARHLTGQVHLLGNRSDIPALLAASDVFLLPSRFEGLGIVYIEAQASGLPVFASDKVPQEAFVTDLIHRISLDAPAEAWAEQLIRHKNDGHQDRTALLREHKYDIASATELLLQEYQKIM